MAGHYRRAQPLRCGAMEFLWVILAAILLVAGWFMVRAFVRLGAAMRQMRESLSELGQMGPRLQQLGEEMTAINQALEQRSRRSEPPPS